MNEPIDPRIPINAKAYLLAASHYLSSWPQDWDAETLALALVDEENINQSKVKIWDAIKEIAVSDDTDAYLLADQMICDLAENFLKFLEENS